MRRISTLPFGHEPGAEGLARAVSQRVQPLRSRLALCKALIMRWGLAAESLAWAVPFLIQALSAALFAFALRVARRRGLLVKIAVS